MVEVEFEETVEEEKPVVNVEKTAEEKEASRKHAGLRGTS